MQLNTSLLILTTLLVLLIGARSSDIILRPSKTGSQEIALVIIQAGDFLPEQYLPLAAVLQNALPFSSWVGIPEFTLNISNPLEFSTRYEEVLRKMMASGMKTKNIYVVAHGLGGILSQVYINSHQNAAKGLILLGSYVLRKYRDLTPQGKSFTYLPLPVLTLAGELDGLTRISRIAEAYYHQVDNIDTATNKSETLPIVVLKGVSHMQFSSGAVPSNVQKYDLQPEVTQDEADSLISTYVTDFIDSVENNKESMKIKQSQAETEAFLRPIIKSLEMEKSYHIKPPCYAKEMINPVSETCLKGSPWVEMAQRVMAGLNDPRLSEIKLINDDNYHKTADLFPYHHPQIWNKCSSPDSSCQLNISTVSQVVYNTLDELDTAIEYISAFEIQAKIKSRQSIWESAGLGELSLNETDNYSICGEINQKALQWALDEAKLETRERYQNYGEFYVIGEDSNTINGGSWIYLDNLTFKEEKDGLTGRDIVKVTSWGNLIDNSFPLEIFKGMHYCKLLSPARAMEWIYLDSLRKYKGLVPPTIVAVA